MSIVLDGITLNPDLIWAERFKSQGVAQDMKRTLGGRAVIYSGQLGSGESITLSSGSPNGSLIGVLKKSVVDSLIDLAEVVDAQYVLTIDGDNFTVVFDWRDGSAVDMTPVLEKTTYGANDLMQGTIKLLTV